MLRTAPPANTSQGEATAVCVAETESAGFI